MIRLLLAILLVAVIALTEQGKPPESVCAGVVHGQTMTATGTRWAEKAGKAIHDLANLAEGTVTPESWDTFKHRLWTGVLKLWWKTFIAAGNGQAPPPEVLKLREQQKQAEDQALLDCAIQMKNLTDCPTGVPPAFDPKTLSLTPPRPSSSNLSGAALAADALRKAAPSDGKWLAQIPLGVAIAKYESSFKPRTANFIFGGHVGFWQISGPNAAHLKLGDRNDPYTNARYAYAIWKGRGGTWARDWTTYPKASRNVGAFQQYAPKATVSAAASGTVPAPVKGQTTAAAAIRAAGKAAGASPITPHLDPQGDASFDLMSRGKTNSDLAEAFRTHHADYNLKYVISQMRIASARSNWNWRPYHPITSSGDFRHVGHVHVTYNPGQVHASATPPAVTNGTGPAPTAGTPSCAASTTSSTGAVAGSAPGVMPSGLRVGTWNTYFGARHSGQSGPSGPARIRKGIKAMTSLTDAFGLQEMSEQSHKDAAISAAGPGWGWVGMNTSHPIGYRKATFRLGASHIDPVFKRSDNYEGPSQGNRNVVTAVLVRKKDGKAVTLVNDHQLPHIEKNGELDTSMPKRIGYAKAIWRTAIDRGEEGKKIGVSIIVGDQNFPGDPNGMFAKAGYGRASSLFPHLPQVSRSRIIDEFYYSAGTPDGEMTPGNWGSDHSGRVLTFPEDAPAHPAPVTTLPRQTDRPL